MARPIRSTTQRLAFTLAPLAVLVWCAESSLAAAPRSGAPAAACGAASGQASTAAIFVEHFQDACLSSRGWYDNTTVVISSEEHAPGSTSSVQYRFLPRATTPTSGGAMRHKFAPSNSVYVGYWVKYSANWVGSGHTYHPHEFYVLSTMDGDWDGLSDNWLTLYLEENYQNGGVPRMAFQDNKAINSHFGALPLNLVGIMEDRSAGGCNGVTEPSVVVECYNGPPWYNDVQLRGPVAFQPQVGAGYKGSWNHVEAYFQLNSIADGVEQRDGVMQYWFNDAPLIDRHDIVFRTAARANLRLDQFVIAPYIGDGSPADQSMWVDDLTVAPARSGSSQRRERAP